MKKIVSLVLVCVMLLGCVCALASCGGGLSGKYQSKSGITTYEFSGKDVTITYELDLGILGKSTKTINGTYELKTNDDDKEVIVFTIDSTEEGADDYEGEYLFVKGTEGDTDYIKIGGAQYNKVKE